MINWPAAYEPARAAVHVRNTSHMAASPELVWAWLVDAERWPSWYPNSRDVRIEDAGPRTLALGTRFRWHTFSLTLSSRVEECVPHERIAWTARAPGVDAYHAWLIVPAADGCDVVTEETQHGWLARLDHLLRPNRMHKFHQIWLERLADHARSGPPPKVG